MSYEVLTTRNFRREAKKLAKKYKSLSADLRRLGDMLAQEPFTGVYLGNNVYKIRLAISSKTRGKSGGARVMTNRMMNFLNKRFARYSIISMACSSCVIAATV